MVWQGNSDGYIYHVEETPNPQLNPRLWQWVLKDGKWKGFSRLDPDVFIHLFKS